MITRSMVLSMQGQVLLSIVLAARVLPVVAADARAPAQSATKFGIEVKIPLRADLILASDSEGRVTPKPEFAEKLGGPWKAAKTTRTAMFFDDDAKRSVRDPIVRARSTKDGIEITYKLRGPWSGGLSAFDDARTQADAWLSKVAPASDASGRPKTKVELELTPWKSTLSTSWERTVTGTDLAAMAKTLGPVLPPGARWRSGSAHHGSEISIQQWSKTWPRGDAELTLDLEVWTIGRARTAEVSFKGKARTRGETGSAAEQEASADKAKEIDLPFSAVAAAFSELRAELGPSIDKAGSSKTDWAWRQH